MAAPPRLAQVPRVWVDQVWPEAVKHLRRAYDRMGGDTPARMYRRVMNGEADLWCIHDSDSRVIGAGLTSVRGSRVTIDILGGQSIADWPGLLAEFENLAKRHGKTEIEIEGRPGWGRLLSGYRVQRIVYRKTL